MREGVTVAIRFNYSYSRIAEFSEQQRKGIQLPIRRDISKVIGKEMPTTLPFKGSVRGFRATLATGENIQL